MDVIMPENQNTPSISAKLLKLMVLDNSRAWLDLIQRQSISKVLLHCLEKIQDHKSLRIIRTRGIQEYDYSDEFLIFLINDLDNYDFLLEGKLDELFFRYQCDSLKQAIIDNIK